MVTVDGTPKRDGFHMPGEFEPHSGCWILWPERPDNWRLGGEPAQAAFTGVAQAIAQLEPVTVGVSRAQFLNARQQLSAAIRVVEISYDDSWIRDTGPTFVVNGEEGGGDVMIHRETPGRFEIEAHGPGRLVVSESFYPGWRVKVDGHKATVEPFEDVFLSVLLPAGKHTVSFNYKPLSFCLGLFLTIVTIFLSIFILHKRKIRNK